MNGVSTETIDIRLGLVVRRFIVHGQVGVQQGLKVKGRRSRVINQQGIGHFRSGNPNLVRQGTFRAVFFGLSDTPGILVAHAVCHVGKIQNILGAGGRRVVVRGFQFPLVDACKALAYINI